MSELVFRGFAVNPQPQTLSKEVWVRRESTVALLTHSKIRDAMR